MVTGAQHRRDVETVERRGALRGRRTVLVLAVLVIAGVVVAAYVWWGRDRATTVGTTAPTDVPVEVQVADLLGEADMKAAWPGPWAVLRTGDPQRFERPLIGCTRAVSPVVDPVSAQVRWSIHAPPQSDGPALSQVLAAARSEEQASDAVELVRAWITECPSTVAGQEGTREAAVVRELPDTKGFLAEVRWSSPGVETYEQIVVGRAGTVVVLLSYGQYGPAGLDRGEPDLGPILEAFDRAVDKLG